MPEKDQPTRTLAAVLQSRQLTLDELLNWSSSIATELSSLHERGCIHGAVRSESVCVENGGARLSSSAGASASPRADHDIQQFAAVLRQMLNRVPAEVAADRVRTAVEHIADTNSRPAPGASMKKIAASLTLLRYSRQIEELAHRRPSPPAPVAVGGRPAPFRPHLIHLFAYFGLAAAIALLGGILVLKLVH